MTPPNNLKYCSKYYMKIDAFDNHGAFIQDNVCSFYTNCPPSAPTISGPTSPKPGEMYDYTFNSIDPEGHDVRFHIDWGDGNTDTTFYVPSGTDIAVSHEWSEVGTYLLTAYAEDEHGAIGPETSFLIYVGSPVIVVHVRELYGTPGNPQYRPLADVTVKIKEIPFFWKLYWSGLTDETGTTESVNVEPGWSYKVIVSKNNYLVYGGVSYTIVRAYITPHVHHVNFTMVKDDSPFVQQYNSQSSQLSSPSVESESVETSVRIHNSKGITPYTLKLTEKESNEIDRIFDNLKVSLDSAESDEEIDEIYDDAVESLYELGLFPKHMTIKEAKQLVNGKSKNQRVTKSSSNLGTGDENFNCQIAGRTTETVMFDLDNPRLDSILFFIRSFNHPIMWRYNFRYYDGKIGRISLGSFEYEYGYEGDYYPAKGWILTNGSHGVVGWIGELYGNIETEIIWWDTQGERGIDAYIGIRNFEGLWIKRLFGDINLLGNAEHVSISKTPPPP